MAENQNPQRSSQQKVVIPWLFVICLTAFLLIQVAQDGLDMVAFYVAVLIMLFGPLISAGVAIRWIGRRLGFIANSIR